VHKEKQGSKEWRTDSMVLICMLELFFVIEIVGAKATPFLIQKADGMLRLLPLTLAFSFLNFAITIQTPFLQQNMPCCEMLLSVILCTLNALTLPIVRFLSSRFPWKFSYYIKIENLSII